MSIEELIEAINIKILNDKTNNMVVKGLQGNEKNRILSSVLSSSSIINYQQLQLSEPSFTSSEQTNIIVDLNDVEYFNILNFVLDQLKIDMKIRLETMRDLLRFKGLLRENSKSVQFIICNADILNPNDCRILNLLLWINSFFLNSVVLLEGTRDLSTYAVNDTQFLDDRENYTKIHLVRY